jgi:DNA-binding NtrC family response regulator
MPKRYISSFVHKILIVDDDRAISSTLAMIFANAGYDVRAASSAEEALELIADWSPDLAILDVVLPEMNGIELAILLKVKYPNCRIKLSSGHPITSDLLAASGHAFEVLAKPVHPETMLHLASQLDRAS